MSVRYSFLIFEGLSDYAYPASFVQDCFVMNSSRTGLGLWVFKSPSCVADTVVAGSSWTAGYSSCFQGKPVTTSIGTITGIGDSTVHY